MLTWSQTYLSIIDLVVSRLFVLGAYIFMTYFHRARGGHGPLGPPLDPLLSNNPSKLILYTMRLYYGTAVVVLHMHTCLRLMERDLCCQIAISA